MTGRGSRGSVGADRAQWRGTTSRREFRACEVFGEEIVDLGGAVYGQAVSGRDDLQIDNADPLNQQNRRSGSGA